MQSIAKSDLEEKLIEEVEAVVVPMGFRVVDLDLRVSRRSLVRVFIDRISESAGAVALQDCTEVSRALDPMLESLDTFTGPFDLEVSSPGLDRRLRLESDFASAVGKQVKLKLRETIETGGKNLTGILTQADGGTLHIEWNKKDVRVALGNVLQANINY